MVSRHAQQKISIELDVKTVNKIRKLGRIDESVPSFIKKTVEHISKCDKWWENRFD